MNLHHVDFIFLPYYIAGKPCIKGRFELCPIILQFFRFQSCRSNSLCMWFLTSMSMFKHSLNSIGAWCNKAVHKSDHSCYHSSIFCACISRHWQRKLRILCQLIRSRTLCAFLCPLDHIAAMQFRRAGLSVVALYLVPSGESAYLCPLVTEIERQVFQKYQSVIDFEDQSPSPSPD